MERLEELIGAERASLEICASGDVEATMSALVRAIDRISPLDEYPPAFDLVNGSQRPNRGAVLALATVLDGAGGGKHLDDGWATGFLQRCERVADMRALSRLAESGVVRIAEREDGNLDAWLTSRRLPAAWRERIDIDSWASMLARQLPNDDIIGRMDYQFPYPPDAVVGGCSVRTYHDALRELIAIQSADPALSIDEGVAIDEIASKLGLAATTVTRALSGFVLGRENARYHAATPDIAAPAIRVGAGRLVLSRFGLRSEPLFFLAHELRRRNPEQYHNVAHVREERFRADLYTRFEDRRFVVSAGRIQLRRTQHDLRTDIDAAVFDRKTGTLALFELKSHEPFARSTAALARQRDNVLYANRQVSGALDWIKRNGADEILNRIDSRVAKTFRVQRVLPFVLGRYLVQFNDGPAPDPRAAWGTWPQLLRLLADRPNEPNPLLSLHGRLQRATPIPLIPDDAPARTIELEGRVITVYPSYARYRETADGE